MGYGLNSKGVTPVESSGFKTYRQLESYRTDYEGGTYIRSGFVYPWITSFLSCSAPCYR